MTRLVLLLLWFTIIALTPVQEVAAHGSITAGEDICELDIGFLKAHFKIYLPETHQRKEFCEDLPVPSKSLFVMEYGHNQLETMLIDFRIIRDVTGYKSFARRKHIAAINNIESVTVLYQQPVVEPDVFTVLHDFDEPGWYIGIVTATLEDDVYTAVFPFEVGFTGPGYWPFFALAIALLLLYLWYDKRRSAI